MIEFVLMGFGVWGLWLFATGLRDLIFGRKRKSLELIIKIQPGDDPGDRLPRQPKPYPSPKHEPEVIEAMQRKRKSSTQSLR